MNLDSFLHQLNKQPDAITFNDTLAVIEAHFNFTPAGFKNGELINEAGQNNGSCKLFAFAQLHQLTPQQTLHCFGDYYRQDVLKNPNGNDHLNIRNFIKHGWPGIQFNTSPLNPKQS